MTIVTLKALVDQDDEVVSTKLGNTRIIHRPPSSLIIKPIYLRFQIPRTIFIIIPIIRWSCWTPCFPVNDVAIAAGNCKLDEQRIIQYYRYLPYPFLLISNDIPDTLIQVHKVMVQTLTAENCKLLLSSRQLYTLTCMIFWKLFAVFAVVHCLGCQSTPVRMFFLPSSFSITM